MVFDNWRHLCWRRWKSFHHEFVYRVSSAVQSLHGARQTARRSRETYVFVGQTSLQEFLQVPTRTNRPEMSACAVRVVLDDRRNCMDRGCGCTRKTEEYGNRPLRSCLQLSYGIETHRLPCSDVSCDGSERYAWPSVEVHVHLEKSRRFSTGRFVHTGWHEFTRTLTDLPTLLDSLISRYGSCRATQELRGRCGCIRLALRHRRLELGVRPVEPSGTLHSGWRLLTAGHPRSRFACGPEMEAGSGGVVRCPSTSGSRWSRITPATTRRRVPGKVCGAACGTLPSANRLIACASLHPARPIPADLRPQP